MQTAENALLPAFGVMFVRLYHTSESPYPVWMALFCFFSGILLGTVWVNRMGASLKEEITGLAPLYWSVHNVKSSVSAGEMALLAGRRFLAAGMIWLSGMTLFAVPGLCLAAAFTGFSLGFLISCMTVQAGIGGLALFLLSVFPQGIFFLPVGLILASWSLSSENRLHGAGFAVLLLLTAAGTAAELWINPLVMQGADMLLH